MGEKGEYKEMNGGIVCLSLVLITAVGAIAGGTLLLTIATYVDGVSKPKEIVVVGGHYYGGEGDTPSYEGAYLDDGVYDDKIWTIGTNHYDTPYNYLDEESGQVIGFNIDVIHEVCLIAGKHCELIRDRFSNAWSNGLGGPGVLGGWYDCYQGWFITYPRLRTVLFTEPYTKSENGWFGVAPGNPNNFDWQDLAGKKVAFFSNWYSDPRCLGRYKDEISGVPLREENILVYDSTNKVIEAVLNGEADATFAGTDLNDVVDALQQVGPLLDRCTIGGSSLMCRKDSHLTTWWNPAWRKLLNSRRHEEFCDRVDNIYNLFDLTSAEVCLTR